MTREEQEDIEDLLLILRDRTKQNSPYYYKGLPPADSRLIQAYYRSLLNIPEQGDLTSRFQNITGTLLAVGYERVVIGDYGPYIEFLPSQIKQDRLIGSDESQASKYVWLRSSDRSQTKVYKQLATVSYADYKAGFFYISPYDLICGEKRAGSRAL